MEVSQKEFNDIMEKAIEAIRLNPDKDTEIIAHEACMPYVHLFKGFEDDYAILVFQVVMNLINLKR